MCLIKDELKRADAHGPGTLLTTCSNLQFTQHVILELYIEIIPKGWS